MINNDLLYYIPSGEFSKEGVLGLLKTHPEIRFVSLVGIDLAGNDTDEKVPIELFLKTTMISSPVQPYRPTAPLSS